MKQKYINTNFLVIGGGVAGLRSAIELCHYGEVTIVTKDMATEGSTIYAQGGIAVALSDEDEVGIHLRDTIKAGNGLCNLNAVKLLVKEGPKRILELIRWGTRFDKDGTQLSFSIEAAHSRKRILHSKGDSTGKEIERTLINKIKSIKSIKRMQFSTAVDLIVEDNMCKGAYILKSGKVFPIFAKAVILTTGGAGQVFSRTTNPLVSTGDGIAMAFRAGAVVEDMEFVQFHPTTLYYPTAPQFLLSEAIRGEGGVLKNINHLSFMKSYHPDAELAPRDIVSRAIVSEMAKTNSKYVYLDVTHIKNTFIKKRFPRIYTTCLKYDIDITKDIIPVCPAAHYIMGGVKVDIDGKTNIKNLYAAGEVACTGVHGANRLASNSLLEGLVFGYRAGKSASTHSKKSLTSFDTNNKLKLQNNITATISISTIEEIRNSIRRLMWEKAGIVRTEKSLNSIKKILSDNKYYIDMNTTTREEIELKNILTVANLIVESALRRQGSVGAHYRLDFPQKGVSWRKHLQIINENRD